ncbi:IclR family transcriptional regulator [Pedococcus sp. 5OH_020]|uniref:IclR family transcriptional regulator n=1 Tax=Pedococcus sp. 5OH_020 TaxID=2989814 RepID=UPI0022E9FEE1|nr:helix-turn-helix domain-containing protein [Pedococcus sp. 5OH_020]
MAGTPTLQTVVKTIDVLEALSQEDTESVSLARVAEVLQWSRAATHQYLASLVRTGWLEQDADRRYRLGYGATLFADAVAQKGGTPPVILRTMEELVEVLQEPISFAILHGDEALIVERREPRRPLIHRNPERHLDLASASGQVLLGFDPRARQELSSELAELAEEARRKGYGEIHNHEWMGDEVEAVAVPIMRGQRCLGALSVIAPAGRMSIPEAVSELVSARARVEEALSPPQPQAEASARRA